MQNKENLISFYDEFGFHYSWPQEQINKYQQIQKDLENKKMEIWDNYFAKCGGIDQIDTTSKEFRSLIRVGVPNCYRATVWLQYLQLTDRMKKSQDIYQQTSKLTEVVDKTFIATIKKDVPRTFANHKTLKRDELERVLAAFTASHPDLGYTQSLNFIAAIIITIIGEEPGYFLLSSIIEDYLPEDYYTKGMHGFQVDLRLLEKMIQELIPNLYEHAKNLHQEWILSASSWLLALYTNCFPIATVLRIWDSFIIEGEEIIFKVAISFLKIHEEELLKATKLGEFTKLIEKFQNEMIDQDLLMNTCFELPITRDQMVDERNRAIKFIDTGVDDSQPKKKFKFFHFFKH